MRPLLALVFALLPVTAFAETAITFAGGRTHATWHGQADVQSLNIELGRAISPRTDVAFVVAPTRFHQPRSWFGDQFGDGKENVNAIAGSLLVRRRFNIDATRASWFLEASMGPMWAEKAIPASTSRFNFVTNFGAGAIAMPRSRFPVMVGYRFSHISNGGYSPRNPGVNVSSVMLGLQLRR